MNSLTKCGYCNNQIDTPYFLSCGHCFCKTCIATNEANGKVTCANCKTVHTGGQKSAKESNLTTFLLKFDNKEYDNIKIDPVEDQETEEKCDECPPLPAPPKKLKPDDPEPPKIEYPKVKLCFHCKKKLCQNCREKHYHATRMEVIKILEDYQGGSTNLLSTTEKLNDARSQKTIEYSKYQMDIKAKKQELIKKLDLEEQTLLKQIDKEIAEEKELVYENRNKYQLCLD